MALIDTYKKRKKGIPEIFIYDLIPSGLKNQIIHICRDFYNQPKIYDHDRTSICNIIEKTVIEEEGLDDLNSGYGHYSNKLENVLQYFKINNDIDTCLSLIEILFYSSEYFEDFINKERFIDLEIKSKSIIAELNTRFKESGIGYQYTCGKIIRIENELLHSETIDRTINLLHNSQYKSVNSEFLTAHEHFRHGRNDDCLLWCNKSFESAMKIICGINKWEYNQEDTAKKLIKILFEKGFLPPFYQNSLNALKNFFETSIPVIRNKLGSHGKGEELKNVSIPIPIVHYMLYITGSTICFLLEMQTERTL